jgi:hypothetical protein
LEKSQYKNKGLEMEMFNTHRRDILSFDNYMDLKKPGFGGPKSAIALRDERGRKINKEPKLADYQRTVERDPAFSNQVYNPTYKAMTHDLVYKQENKKPFKYTDPYRTAVPVIEYDPTSEGKTYTSFNRFINEDKSLEEIEAELLSYESGANPAGEEEESVEDFAAKFPPEFGKPDKETMNWLKGVEAGANPEEYFSYGTYPEMENHEIADDDEGYNWENWEDKYGMYGSNPEEGGEEDSEEESEEGEEGIDLSDVTVDATEADPYESDGWGDEFNG